MIKIKTTILLAALMLLAASAGAQKGAYVRQVEKWRADHAAEISGDGGWLTVAGLFWLKEGANTVGAGPGYDVELTENFKRGRFGEINFQNGVASLKIENGVEAAVDGVKITSAELISDEDGKPTVVASGSQSFYLIKREDRFGIRLKDKRSAGKLAFKGLHWFPVDPAYKVAARFEPFAAPREVSVPNVLGGAFKMKSPGVLKFRLRGREYSLQPVEEGDQLFVIFRDATSKSETYGAGRFLYAAKPGRANRVTLDFNKAENPPCAFTSFATCPLPPLQNRLDAEIKAGEKRYDH